MKYSEIMKKPQSYRPINCSFYDELERAATLKQQVRLAYTEEDKGEVLEKEVTIVNLQAQNGEEYLTTASGWRLRLDRIIHIDGKQLTENYCGI